MSDYTAADILFIVLVLALIHGIMLVVGWIRSRKPSAGVKSEEKS